MNHYRIQTPWVVSFSGGRTSAFMLRQILQASDGLPSDCRIVFANTGREHPATLDFVREVARRWSVPINWVERRAGEEPGFAEVTYENASRNGEPFSMLIAKKNYLPNPVARFCTEELKVRAIAMFCKSQGMEDGTMVIGLRADEERRVRRVQGDTRFGFTYECPMFRAGHSRKDVEAYWETAPFDLMLPNNDKAFGNCDLCFLKSRSMLERVMRHDERLPEWWIAQENAIGATFRSDRPSYRQMLVQVRIQPELFAGDDDDSSAIPCICTE